MMKKATHSLHAKFGTPQLMKRAMLFTGGAITGAVVSVSASYAVVSALFPRQAEPTVIAARPDTALPTATAPGVFLASAPADRQIDVTPLDPLPGVTGTTTAPEMLAAAAPVAAQPIPAPAALPAPGGDLIVATKSVADSAVPLPADEVATEAPRVLSTASAEMPARALSAPELRPDSSQAAAPASFAALAAGDATARTGATLGFAEAATRPAPRPETDTVTETPVDPALDSLAAADPDMPRLRPAPRPEALPVVLAAATPADLADAIPGTRPQPRPEIIQVAASSPAAAQSPQPLARRSGGLFSRGSNSCGSTLARSMPRRSGGAATGSAFFAALGGLSGTERDQRVIDELARGNMPKFLRDLQPVTFRGKDARGADTEIVICVTPDYLALGSDRDYVRVPLGLPAAARIAGRFDMTLPTPRMVDAIYAQADVKLSPSPMQAGPQMSSTAYLLRHNATIESQLRGRHGLVAGQKKDVVMASRMASAPGRVAIYGWHRSATSPIQPVSTVHGANYADYSHGIRLVSKTAYLNGRAVDLDELLSSGRYAYLLNKEGPLPGPVIRTASR